MKKIVIDVRSQDEFMGGHVAGSINIPLNEIPEKVNAIKAMGESIVLCCASGNRSGQAQRFLMAQGIDCVNGGSWLDVQ